MNDILLNSLNKKILGITVLVLIVGLFFRANISDKYSEKAYMHETKKKPTELLNRGNFLTEKEDISIQFLPTSEVEQVLKDYEYERLYIKSDTNFDKKVENIKKYLQRRNSPLAEKAEYIVIMANKFHIDYRLLPAISIVESSGGIRLYRKYNAWGWGGSRGFTFDSWDHSIYVVSKGLGRYYKSGAVTPEQMAPMYNPHTPNEWAGKVRGIMNQIGPDL